MKNKYRVEDLPNAYIDYYVAQAEGVSISQGGEDGSFRLSDDNRIYRNTESGRVFTYSPTADWRLAGPIIEKSGISIRRTPGGWEANHNGEAVATGPTLLVAAMRTRAIMAYGRELELDE